MSAYSPQNLRRIVSHFDNKRGDESLVRFVRITLGIGDHAGPPDVIVIAMVDMSVDPEMRLMPEDEFLKMGGVGTTERLVPAVCFQRSRGWRMVSHNDSSKRIVRIQKRIHPLDATGMDFQSVVWR